MPPPSRSLAGLGRDFAFTNLRLALGRISVCEPQALQRICIKVLLANSASCPSCGTTFFVVVCASLVEAWQEEPCQTSASLVEAWQEEPC